MQMCRKSVRKISHSSHSTYAWYSEVLAWRQTTHSEGFHYFLQYFQPYAGIVSWNKLQSLSYTLSIKVILLFIAIHSTQLEWTPLNNPRINQPSFPFAVLFGHYSTYQQVQPSCQLLSVPSCSAPGTSQRACRTAESVQPPDGSRSGCVSWSSEVRISPTLPPVT